MKKNNLIKELKGIITVLNTPFNNNNNIDLHSLGKNVKFAIESGVSGFLVPAMASEVSKLSFNERNTMVSSVVDEVAGKVPVIGGSSAKDTHERIKIAKSLIDIGCDGVLVNIPYVNAKSFKESIYKISALDPPFLMIQDWDFQGYGIPIDIIIELFNEIDCFKAIKVEVVPAGVKYSEILNATNGNLHVSGGWAVMQMIEAFDRGVHAIMPTGMHDIYNEIYCRYKTGNRDQAISLFNEILPVLAFSNQHLDISVHFFKRLLYAQGIYNTSNVRTPILPFDEFHVKNTEYLINRIKKISKKI